MGRPRSSVEDLRLAIDCLPLRTREAMLTGIRSHEIIVGAYSDRAGGRVPDARRPPLRRAHELRLLRPRWDRFARAKRARTATVRELRALEAHLDRLDLAERGEATSGAIADHQTLVRERKAGEAAAWPGLAAPRDARATRSSSSHGPAAPSSSPSDVARISSVVPRLGPRASTSPVSPRAARGRGH
jgi:hypothetical protein